jgi:hypothetical protein
MYNLKGKLSLGQRHALRHQEKHGQSFQEDESLGGQRGASPSSRTTIAARKVTAAAKAVT